ncbi:NepR family anti-sigma factor [Devosia sp. A449]
MTQQRMRTQAGRADDGLGPNTDIGARLRALYGAVQDEGVPEQLLDLLEKLDNAEQSQKAKAAPRDGKTAPRDGE